MSFEKFTDKARKVLVLAQEEAKKLGQPYVGTEHILLGLILEHDGLGAQALDKLNVEYDEVVKNIKEVVKIDPNADVSGHLNFSPRVKRVLENALREAMQMGQSYISTEHLLLGIVREGEGTALEVLSRMNVSQDAIREALNDMIGQSPVFAGRNPFDSGSSKGGGLKEFGIDLTQRARDGKLDPVIGRAREIERAMQILSRRQKNNPLLIGEPGTGKTAVAEGLAQLIVSNQVPDVLRGTKLITLDVSGMVAGSRYRGEFEERLKKCIDEVMEEGNIILFVDEIHTLIGAGNAEGSLDAASILKPPLSRGELQVIGATTSEEFRKHMEKDTALVRRFQTIAINEPDEEQAFRIVEGLADRYERHHNVKYTPDALHSAVVLSARYVQDKFLPDKAIDVIDEAGARMRIKNMTLPDDVRKLDEKLRQVNTKKERAISEQKFDRAGELKEKEDALRREREKAMNAALEEQKQQVKEIGERDIADVVSMMTGVPLSDLTEAETEKLLRMEGVLHERVIGQDEAVTALSKAIRRSRAGLKDPRRPSGSFIFLGPSGVGKTELSKALAEFLFNTEDALISLDMSEYMEKHSVSRLVGSPPGYVGHDEGGQLTKAVRARPYSVVLFDEIEKAHPDVFNILLQILEEGRLTDTQGRTVDFRNTVIIMTSNVGAQEIAQTTTLGFGGGSERGLSDDEIKKRAMSELKKLFRPEFLNRVDEIIVFKSLTDDEQIQIVKLMVDELRDRLIDMGMTINITDAACKLIAAQGTDATYGARPLRRAIQTLLEDPISEDILQGRWSAGAGSVIDVDVEGAGAGVGEAAGAGAGDMEGAGGNGDSEGEEKLKFSAGEGIIPERKRRDSIARQADLLLDSFNLDCAGLVSGGSSSSSA